MKLRHRHLLAAPFALLALVALVGGAVNSVDARGLLLDDFTDLPVKDARVSHGFREDTTGEDGRFELGAVPRTSRLQIDRNGYLRTQAPPTAEEIRLSPISLTLYAYDETKGAEGRVNNPQARDPGNTKIIATGTAAGQIVIAPHPGRDVRLLVCGEGFEPKEIQVSGVLMEILLKPGGTGCPPLPTPTPDPSATPTPTPTAAPAEPTPTPAPTGTP